VTLENVDGGGARATIRLPVTTDEAPNDGATDRRRLS